jgi:hypothetical protein
MSTALTLVVLIASGAAGGGASDPSAGAMVRAARHALGAATRVIVRDLPPSLDDADAVAMGHALGADVVVELAWGDAARRRATVRVHADAAPRWIDRDIGFDAGDADRERGRTLGFAVASMLPEREGAPPRDEIPDDDAPEARDPGPTPEVRPRPRARFAVDALGAGSIGVAGYADAVGGAVRAAWYVGPRFALRAGGAFRTGSIVAADGTLRSVALSAGVGWRAVIPSSRAPLGAGLRADAVLLRDIVARSGGGEPAQGRWLPAVDLTLEGTYRAFDPVSFVFAGGAELAFGATDVLVAGRQVAAIPPLRLVGEVGIRLEF